MGWPAVREGTLDQEKNPLELLLGGCGGGGHGEPGWKQNQRGEFRVGDIPSNTALKAVLPLEGVGWGARGRGESVGCGGVASAACALHQGG